MEARTAGPQPCHICTSFLSFCIEPLAVTEKEFLYFLNYLYSWLSPAQILFCSRLAAGKGQEKIS